MKKTTTLITFLLTVLISFAQSEGIERSKILLFLPFDGNTNVSEPSGVSISQGAATGSVSYVEGREGQAIDFNGDANFVTSGLNLNVNRDFSVLAWYNLDRFSSNYGKSQFILHQKDVSGMNPGRILMEYNIENCISNFIGNNGQKWEEDPHQTNTWFHYAVTYSRSNGRKYQYANGSLVKNLTCNNEANNGELVIGSNKTENNNFYDGKLDDLLIYDGKLTDAQIQRIMNDGVDRSIIQNANISLTANETSSTFAVNSTKTYTYTLTTSADVDYLEIDFSASDVTLDGTPSAGVWDGTTWDLGTFSAGTATLSLQATPTQSGNTAIEPSLPDLIIGTHTVDDIAINAVSDIDLTPSLSKKIMEIGETLEINYKIKNNRTSTMNSVYVEFFMPANYELATPPDGTLGAPAFTWNVGNLSAGEEATNTFEIVMNGNGSGDITAVVYEGAAEISSTSVGSMKLYDAAAVPVGIWAALVAFAGIAGVGIFRRKKRI